MNTLPKHLQLVRHHGRIAAEKAEYYKAKSQAKNARKEAQRWQESADNWAELEELLEELIRLRNERPTWLKLPGNP